MEEKKFPIIETQRLRLRQLDYNDVPTVKEYLSDPDVVRYIEMSLDTIEKAKGFVSWAMNGYFKGEDIRWGIELKESNVLIGDCGFGHINETKLPTEIGYMLDKKYWNNGYMSEALKGMLEYGFDVLKLHRVQGWVHPDNNASAHILEKQGFKYEGFLREYAYMWHKGCFTDVKMYALINSDYFSKRS